MSLDKDLKKTMASLRKSERRLESAMDEDLAATLGEAGREYERKLLLETVARLGAMCQSFGRAYETKTEKAPEQWETQRRGLFEIPKLPWRKE